MPRIRTHSEEETRRLGERLGGRLRAGDVVLLSGELGAGKSVLARGIARGMGVAGPVPSPTFVLMTVNRGARLPLYHMDLYRLEDARALWESGLEEYIGGDGVAVIEWPERALEAMPAKHLAIELSRGGDAEARDVCLTPCGGFSPELTEALLVRATDGSARRSAGEEMP